MTERLDDEKLREYLTHNLEEMAVCYLKKYEECQEILAKVHTIGASSQSIVIDFVAKKGQKISNELKKLIQDYVLDTVKKFLTDLFGAGAFKLTSCPTRHPTDTYRWRCQLR
jgi:hypothetical protein